VPAGIALVAFALRLIYLLQLRATPLFHSPGLDSAYYLDQARAIRSGDWIGREVFFMGPLYPYVLALLSAGVGTSTFGLLLAQCALGSLGPVLLYFLGCRLLDRPTATLAALATAGYGMLILYDNHFLMEWLLTLLILAVLLQLASVGSRTGAVVVFGGGVLLGLAALGRASLLLFVPGALLWLWLGGGTGAGAGGRRRTGWILAYAAGIALAIAPVAARNAVVGRDRVLITSNGGLNLFIGNNPIGRGTYMPLDQVARAAGVKDIPIDVSWMITDPSGRSVAEAALKRSLRPSEVSAFYTRRTLDYARADPGRALRILGRKLLLFWNATEIAQIEDPALYRDLIPLMRAPLVSFGVAGPLALAGLALALTGERRRRLLLLTLFVAAFTLSVVAFFVTARYRAPAVPVLLLLAAFAVVELGRRARDARRRVRGAARQLAWSGLALAGFAVVTHLDLVHTDRAAAYISLGIALADEGRDAEAIAAFARAVEAAPGDPVSRYNLGAAYLKAGRLEEAAATFRGAVELAPRSVTGWAGLAESHARLGQPEPAAAAFRRAAALAGKDASLWFQAGRHALAAGQIDSARGAASKALALEPGNEAIHQLVQEIEVRQERRREH
jgi:Flp pilus assembly protein TadD